MVAQQNMPVGPRGLPTHQMIDHATAVRPAVDQITHMNDGCGAVLGHVTVNQRMRGLQQRQVAVDIPDGVGAHDPTRLLRLRRDPRSPERGL